jgi:hypothetical protein
MKPRPSGGRSPLARVSSSNFSAIFLTVNKCLENAMMSLDFRLLQSNTLRAMGRWGRGEPLHIWKRVT